MLVYTYMTSFSGFEAVFLVTNDLPPVSNLCQKEYHTLCQMNKLDEELKATSSE